MSEVSCRLTLTSFVPRQVMLEMATNAAIVTSKDDNCMKKKRRKDDPVAVMEVEDEGKKSKKKKSSKISNPVDDGSGSAEILAFDRPSSDAISLKGKWREDLLRSIAAFLEGNGFVKTLSVFCSEARIEVNSRGGSCINLEDLYNKFIELSRRDPVVSIEWSKEQGKLIFDVDDSDAHTKDKKRKIKQVSDPSGQKNSETNCLDATIGAEENTDNGKTLKVEKKKKHKVILGENMGEVACVNIEELAKEKIEKLNDLTNNPTIERFDFEKDKGEKKKKKKEVEQFLELSELGVNHKVIADGGSTKHQESVKSDNTINDLPENVDGSKKEKKKNKNKKLEKSTSDSLHAHSSDKLVEGASDGVGKHDDGLQKFGIRKDSFAIIKENIADVETTTNKKRKRSSSKETEIQIENITAAGNSKESKPDVTKVEKETGDLKVLISSEPSPLNQKSIEPCQFTGDKDEKNANLLDPLKQMSGHQVANGELEKHQKEGSTRQKSMKKEKHSGDLKVGNAFQRVKVDEVQFADERLQNNSYWALDDSGSGYGAKAQEVLGQVRGRDFRHEKTKKKRGTYRGGQIDLHSHSIKFNYSDEE